MFAKTKHRAKDNSGILGPYIKVQQQASWLAQGGYCGPLSPKGSEGSGVGDAGVSDAGVSASPMKAVVPARTVTR